MVDRKTIKVVSFALAFPPFVFCPKLLENNTLVTNIRKKSEKPHLVLYYVERRIICNLHWRGLQERT